MAVPEDISCVPLREGWQPSAAASGYLHAIKSMVELGEAYTRSELEGADY